MRARYACVSDRHGVSRLTPHHPQEWRILTEVGRAGVVSQRALARQLGIALGLTNQLVRSLSKRGLIRRGRITPTGRMEYRLTRAGRTHCESMCRERMQTLVQAYAEAKRRVENRLVELDCSWTSGCGEKRVVFYDDGSIPELGRHGLRLTSLRLVGVVSPDCAHLAGRELAGKPFDRLVVMSFAPAAAIWARLRHCGVSRSATFWI